MERNKFFLVVTGVLLLTFFVRMYRFNAPIADWHSWRQVDTAAVARNFVKLGFDPLRPKYDDLSNIQSGKDNLEGYRFVEFPIYQIIAYGLFNIIPILTIEQSLRIVSIFASVITCFVLMVLTRKYAGVLAAIASGFVYAIIPYSVYYGRSILPEPTMIAFSVSAVLLIYRAIEAKGKISFIYFLLSALCSSLALLAKPFAFFLLGPIGWLIIHFILEQKGKSKYVAIWISLLYGLIALSPLFMWRQWITNFPEGIPVSSWLFNEGNIRFKGAWFYWLFSERISKLLFGQWGIVFVVLGFFTHLKAKGSFVYWWGIGSLAYMIIIARGNVQHDYYQQLLLPFLTIMAGLGISFIATYKNVFIFTRIFMIITIFCFSVAFSWYEVRGFFWINKPEIIEAGQAANAILPQNAKVIVPYNGDTTFLYQTQRQGWPIGFEIDKKITMGATHYVTISSTDKDDETKTLAEKYTVLVRNDRYAIIDLTQPKATSSAQL